MATGLLPEGRTAITCSAPRREPLDELDWTTVVQQPHRYRCWVWHASGLEIAGTARALAAECLADWRLSPMTDDVVLCVSELISNALTHGAADAVVQRNWAGSVSLGLRYFPTSCLFVEVDDASAEPPLIARMGPAVDPVAAPLTNGRGLVIVREVADHLWWKSRPGGHKTVYARLDTSRYFEPLVDGDRD